MWHSWKDVSSEEMKAFFGVILNMALNLKAQLVDYFTEDWLDRTPFFKDVFSRLRFLQIFWITLKKIINKNTLIILCNLKYIIKSSDEFIFMFFSFKTVG